MGRATDGSSAELEVGTLGWLLFRLIFFQNDAQLCHGQVTSNANGQHSLTNQPGQHGARTTRNIPRLLSGIAGASTPRPSTKRICI
ncbi:hypothetical protein PPTG_21966 [Phytophthora nicotianae INRA-310]|uniref:Uncharacterized protein n=1 Tax=Phytophthora nicotianae (strain INRA-310) TaxID=761204 RepID=W2QR49_PHYN3|nr:hypothetical protein PPTG_21966 [Phytophthora nicotianae INRA-310]ETN15588.1 hypothetical protein PPTG_21966 [Phytophthora nicotianae INRA-310]